jgi:hypothetical protein
MKLHPVRHGQLKKLIATPVQIRLAFFTGARREISSLRACFLVRRLPEHCRFVKAGGLCVHAEMQVGIARRQNIVAGVEFPRDGFFAGPSRGQVVIRAQVRLRDHK